MSNHASARDLDWCVSRTCESGACVRVARRGDSVLISNTSNPEGPINEFTTEEWRQLGQGVWNPAAASTCWPEGDST
jgi:hypothetical protein